MSEPKTVVGVLDYANDAQLMLPHVEVLEDGSLTITVPTRRTAWQFVCKLGSYDARAFFLILPLFPVIWLIFKLLATRRPRAVIQLTSKQLSICESRDDEFGLSETYRAWPLDQIGECRQNRYENGLWVTITGRDSFNLLPDQPPKSISIISQAICDVRQKYADTVQAM